MAIADAGRCGSRRSPACLGRSCPPASEARRARSGGRRRCGRPHARLRCARRSAGCRPARAAARPAVACSHRSSNRGYRRPGTRRFLASGGTIIMSPMAVLPILYAAPPTHPAESVPHVGTERGNPVDEPHIAGSWGESPHRLWRSANSFSASPTANPVGLRKRKGWFVVLQTCVWLAPHSDRQLAAGNSGEFCRRRVRVGGSEVRRPSTAPRVTGRRCDNASARSDRSGLLDHEQRDLQPADHGAREGVSAPLPADGRRRRWPVDVRKADQGVAQARDHARHRARRVGGADGDNRHDAGAAAAQR